jgi:hypothetical protein
MDFLNNSAVWDAFTAAIKSSLGIVGLVVLITAFVAILLFKSHTIPPNSRLFAFLGLLLFDGLMVGIVSYNQVSPAPEPSPIVKTQNLSSQPSYANSTATLESTPSASSEHPHRQHHLFHHLPHYSKAEVPLISPTTPWPITAPSPSPALSAPEVNLPHCPSPHAPNDICRSEAIVNDRSTLLTDWNVGRDCMMKQGSQLILTKTSGGYNLNYDLKVLTRRSFYVDNWYQRWFVEGFPSKPYTKDYREGYIESDDLHPKGYPPYTDDSYTVMLGNVQIDIPYNLDNPVNYIIWMAHC